MTLPPLPTDNLYKFIALSGVTLIVLYFILQFQTDTQFKNIDVENSVFGERITTDLDEALNEYEKSIKNLENVCRSEGCECVVTQDKGKISIKYLKGCKDTTVPDELLKIVTETEKKAARMRERVKDYKDRTNSFKFKAEAWVKQQAWLFNLLFLPGIVLTIGGFILWYVKVQRFQDTILKAQAKAEN